MSNTNSGVPEESDPSYKDLTISEKYSFDYNLIKIVDLTIHTVRQSWILLRESLPYDLDIYLKEGSKYPDFEDMKRYVKFSSLAYISVYSVGTVICEVTKPDPQANPSKSGPFGKISKSKSKIDPCSVVIVALSVLPNHSGIGLSVKLLDYTINRIKEAKLSKVYALADETSQYTVNFYRRRGFSRSECMFTEVIANLKVEYSKDYTVPSFIVMEMSLNQESTK